MSCRVRVGLLVTALLPCGANAQADGARPVGPDSTLVRFVDADLRSVVQALGQFLDRPLLINALPDARVTVETQSPVPNDRLKQLLQGVLASHDLELFADSAAGLFRVRPHSPAAPAVARASEPVRADSLASIGVRLHLVRLRHARASDVAATISALYGQPSALSERGDQRPPSLSDGLRADRIPPVGVRTGASGSRVVERLAGVDATLSGSVTIVPDAGTNGLLIRAAPRDFALIEAAIEALDVRPLQVLIEVLIAEVRKDRGFGFGVATEVPPTPVGTGNTTVQGSTSGIGLGDFALSVMNLGGVDMNATLRAAAARGDVTINSRPVILAANNEPAEILVGSQRPFIQVSRSLPTDAPQRDQVVQYRDVGTRLSVRPTISADGYVMLEVLQEVNAVTSETAFDAPVISTRTVQTRLLVRSGQTAVLGGLADRQRDANQEGVPLLSAIPLLGGLFGRASRRELETELFVFITPRVLFSDEDVDGATGPLQSRMTPED